MEVPPHIGRNRHRTWYFRSILPADFPRYFPNHKREIKRSLRTDSKILALRLARTYRVEFDDLLNQLENMTKKHQDSRNRVRLKTGIDLDFGDGSTLKIDSINHDENHEPEKETLQLSLHSAPRVYYSEATAGSMPASQTGSL